MKRFYILFCLITLLVCKTHSQHFIYRTESNYIYAEPTFDQLDVLGKKIGVLPHNKRNIDGIAKIVNEITSDNVSTEALIMLKASHSMLRIYFHATIKGEIFHLRFRIHKNLFDLITDEQLFAMYKRYKATKLDFTKQELKEQYKNLGRFDFGHFTISAFSKE